MADPCTGDVLDLIDAAVADWETSEDAVRYNRPQPRTFADAMSEIADAMAAMIPSMLAAAEALQDLTPSWTGLLAFIPCTSGRQRPCACHPRPFPAARDYRRRTKRRRRRLRGCD